MTDPSNNSPINQAALFWLRHTGERPNPKICYLAQLASWGLGEGARWPRSASVNAPQNDEVEYAMVLRLGETVEEATGWFLWNINLSEEEQEGQFLYQLHEAKSPLEAAESVLEMACDAMQSRTGY